MINSRHNYTKPSIVKSTDNKNTSCKTDKCVIKCPKKCCCIQADLFVEKTLLSVYKVVDQVNAPFTDTVTPYTQLFVSYEIALINESCCKISNLGIDDTFFGMMSNLQIIIGLRIKSCCDNVVIRDLDAIYADDDCTQILDTSKSFMPPCSACSIIVTVIFEAFPDNGPAEIERLMNTITVTGTLDAATCNCKQTPIESIVKKSIVLNLTPPVVFAGTTS
jgi:hypothetical protein